MSAFHTEFIVIEFHESMNKIARKTLKNFVEDFRIALLQKF